MAARWPVADLCTEVLAELDATEQLLRPATPDDASPRAFRTLVLGHVEPLRTSVSRLARDADSQSPQTSSGLPASIQREAISILDSCERTLAAIRHETVEDTLNSTIISPASRESAALQQLRSFNDRMKIVLDLRSLSSTNLLGADGDVGAQGESVASATSKADMLVALAQMRGLFVSNKAAPDGPPTYDEAVQDQQPLAAEKKSQSSHSSRDFETAKDKKVDSAHVSNAKPAFRDQSQPPTRIRPQSGELKATKLATIQKKAPPGRESGGIIFTRCVSGKDGGRLALTTPEALELYNATSGTLLWKLEGSFHQFIQWYKDPITFTTSMQFSPDGSILCVEIWRSNANREILILDTQEGRVITRRNLGHNDGTVPHISPDNTKVALFRWSASRETENHIKIIPIDLASNNDFRPSDYGPLTYGFNTIPIPPLGRGGGISMTFAADSKHIITCEGNLSNPRLNPEDTPFSTCIRVYRCTISGGTEVSETRIPGSRPLANPLFETFLDLPMSFHYPSLETWLISFSDYTENMSKTRIVEARTGETVALVSAERDMWQSWKSGVLQPHKAEMTFDKASGRWTRMELTKTILPPGQTVTITRFELPGSSWRQGSLKSVKDAWSMARSQVVVLNVGADDLCDLSRDGTRLVVRREASRQVDVWSIGG